MRAAFFLLWAACVLFAQNPPPSDPAPLYVPSSIVNAASPNVTSLAPNTLATLYGTRLAHATKALTTEDIRRGVLPTILPGTGVRVIVGGLPAPLLYVSPGQVNFLVPADLQSGRTDVRLVLDARNGPTVQLQLADVSPALFQADPEFVVAARADGSVITPKSPAHPGEVVVLYATGLGSTRPAAASGEIVRSAARLERLAEFRVTVGDQAVPAEDVLYAGAAPGFAGVYQINLRLPGTLEANPEIRIGFRENRSPAGVRIPLATGSAAGTSD
jgi:uncharacterized protein (TIGR03437 family)